MHPRAARSDAALLERTRPNPFRTSFHWVLGPSSPGLVLDSVTSARPVSVPERPTLFTGAVGSGRRATLDRVAEQATRDGWVVVRVDARNTDLEAHVLDDAVSDASDRQARAGVLVCVDALHAATPSGCGALLAALASSDGFDGRPPLRVVASTTHRTSPAVDVGALAGFDVIELMSDAHGMAVAFCDAAESCGRELGIDAVLALHAASQGVVGVALEHAAVAWDTTRDEVIGRRHITAVRSQVDAARHAHLRATHASSFSLGERRYLRAIAAHGTDHVPVAEVARTLAEMTHVTLTGSMLDAVSAALVRQGVLIVLDGIATVAHPGLAHAV